VLKFLIISFIVMYLFFKLFGFLLRRLLYTLGARMTQKHKEAYTRQYQQAQKREGEISIDYVPANKDNSAHKTGKSKDEEYVDYEEVK
jgi:hypothetical protein